MIGTRKVLQRRVMQFPKGKRDRPSSPSLGPRSLSKDSNDGKGAAKRNVPNVTSPSGKPNQPSCFSNLKGKCTKPSCNCWHPPECVKHKTNEGCQFWESVRFVSHNNEAPRNTSKKRTRHLKITILQFYAVIPNWVVHLRTSNYQNKRLDLRT